MKLTVAERFVLQRVLPPETNYVTLKAIGKLRKDLSFSDEENRVLQFRVELSEPVVKKVFDVVRSNPAFSREEISQLEIFFQKAGGMMLWDGNAEPPGGAEIPVGEIATIEIVKALKQLNEQNKLGPEHLTLYEKFVAPPPQPAAK